MMHVCVRPRQNRRYDWFMEAERGTGDALSSCAVKQSTGDVEKLNLAEFEKMSSGSGGPP